MSKPGSTAKLLWGIGLFLLGWAVVGGMLLRKSANDYTARTYTRMEIQQISTALTKFQTEAGALPEGGPPSLFRALAGSNSPHPIFFVSSHTNASGEALDFWGTPYHLERSDGTNFVVTSAGKNKTFGDADDVGLTEPGK